MFLAHLSSRTFPTSAGHTFPIVFAEPVKTESRQTHLGTIQLAQSAETWRLCNREEQKPGCWQWWPSFFQLHCRFKSSAIAHPCVHRPRVRCVVLKTVELCSRSRMAWAANPHVWISRDKANACLHSQLAQSFQTSQRILNRCHDG